MNIHKKLIGSGTFLVVWLSCLTAVTTAQSDTITVSYAFPKPEIMAVKFLDTIFHQVNMKGLYSIGDPGKPELPCKAAMILLPPGHNPVSVTARLSPETKVPGEYLILPGQYESRLQNESVVFTAPDSTVYQSLTPFPPLYYSQDTVQNSQGFRILIVRLYPVRYIPVKRLISYWKDMTLTVVTNFVEDSLLFFRGHDADFEKITNIIDNPEQLVSYKGLRKSPKLLDMVIITNKALRGAFNDYANWKTNKCGIHTVVQTVESIYIHCKGIDKQEKIRKFIIDAYNLWGIDYVLLGGDIEIVPVRKAWGEAISSKSGLCKDSIPCDFYFGDLTGNWDFDGDGKWGELNEDKADLFAEVFVGRVPVNTEVEVNNFFYKVSTYEESEIKVYHSEMLFLGSVLEPPPNVLWGAEYKDYTANYVPAGYNITKLNARDNTLAGKFGNPASLAPERLEGLDQQNVVDAIKSGVHFVNLNCHGDAYSFLAHLYQVPFLRKDVDNLTNNEYCLVYSGCVCYTASFDSADAIGEHFIFNKHGAFALIGGSRESWYSVYGPPEGTSFKFELNFYIGVFIKQLHRLGPAMQYSKEKLAYIASCTDLLFLYVGQYYRWNYWSLTLLGDPSTKLVMPKYPKLTERVKQLIVYPTGKKEPRDWFITLSGPAGASGILEMPSSVSIAKGAKDTHITKTSSCLGLFPWTEKWIITVTIGQTNKETTIKIPGLAVNNSVTATLKLKIPLNAPKPGELLFKLRDQVGGKSSGGMDYLVKY